MKNSKFLKKSLALLLALMMLVAMIPVGASAAAPTFQTFKIAGITLTGSGNTYTGSMSSKEFTAAEDFTAQWLINGSGTTVTYGKTNDEATEIPGDVTAIGGTFDKDYFNVNDAGTEASVVIKLSGTGTSAGDTFYTVKLTLTAPSNDMTVEKFDVVGQISSVISGSTITVTMPYTDNPADSVNGLTFATTPEASTDAGKINIKMKANNAYGAVSGTAGQVADAFFSEIGDPAAPVFWDGTKYVDGTLKVASEAGGSDTYTVKFVNKIGTADFKLATQESAVIDQGYGMIDADNASTGTPTITITLPYANAKDADGDDITELKLAPTFTTGVASKVELITDAGGEAVTTTLTTGVAKDFFAALDGDKTHKIRVTSTSAPITVKEYAFDLAFNPSNPEAAITGFTAVAGSTTVTETGKVNGSSLTIEFGASANLGSVDVTFEASESATVSVPFQDGKSDTVAEGKVTLTELDLSDAAGVDVMVQAADSTKAPVYYKLKATKKTGQATPALSSFVVKKDKNTFYTGTITTKSPYTIKIAAPYALTTTELQEDGYQVLYTKNDAGITVEYNDGADWVAFESGAELDDSLVADGTGIIPEIGTTAATNKTSIKVTADLGSAAGTANTKTYTVTWNRAAAATGKQLTAFSTTESKKMEESTTYAGTIGTEKVGTSTVNTVSVLYPYGEFESDSFFAKQLALFTANDKAGVYLSNGTALTALTSTTADAEGSAIDLDGAADYTGTVGTDYFDLYVLSELVAYEVKVADITTQEALTELLTDAKYKSGYTVYRLYAKRAEARPGNTITSFSFVDENGKTIPATVSGTTISVKMPWTYANDGSKALYPVFTANPGASVYTDRDSSTLAADGVKFTSGGVKDAEGDLDPDESSYMVVDWDGANYTTNTPLDVVEVAAGAAEPAVAVPTLYCFNEAGNKSTPYTFSVIVQEAKSGADLTAFALGSYRGTVDQTKETVVVTVPLGTSTASGDTKVVTLVPTYTASEMAEVTLNTNAITAEEVPLAVGEEHTITVVSEDESETKTYKLTIVERSDYDDVKEGAWYYDDVMKATSYGLLKGTGNNKFTPNSYVKRGDFALMVARMFFNSDEEINAYEGKSKFVDVDDSDYFGKAVAFCTDKKIINGYPDSTFKPGDYISRAALATIIANTLELKEVTNPTSGKFADDASIPGWAKGFVYAAKDAGILEGTNNVFNAGGNTTRAAASKVLVAMYDKKNAASK